MLAFLVRIFFSSSGRFNVTHVTKKQRQPFSYDGSESTSQDLSNSFSAVVASCGRICESRRAPSKSDKTRLSEINKVAKAATWFQISEIPHKLSKTLWQTTRQIRIEATQLMMAFLSDNKGSPQMNFLEKLGILSQPGRPPPHRTLGHPKQQTKKLCFLHFRLF